MTVTAEQHLIHFEVDAEHLETTDKTLTVAQVLELAHLDPATHYLIEIDGQHQKKHTDPDEQLHLHEHERFISVFTGPTPVS